MTAPATVTLPRKGDPGYYVAIRTCSHPGCAQTFEVLVADACVEPEQVEVRCDDHPPTEGEWVWCYYMSGSDQFFLRALVPEPIAGRYYAGSCGGITYAGECMERKYIAPTEE